MINSLGIKTYSANIQIDDRQEIGIGGFTALARVRNVVEKAFDIPDSPVEDGSIMHDHRIIKPVTLSLEGVVSDVHVRETLRGKYFRRALAQIGIISRYIPGKTQTQLTKINGILLDIDQKLQTIDSYIKDGDQLMSFFGDKTEQKTNQELFIEALEEYEKKETVMDIQMPDKIYRNMIISTLVLTWDNEKGTAIDFKITAKQILVARIEYTESSQYFKNPAEPDVKNQVSKETNKGLNKAPDVDTSFLSRIKDAFK